MAVSFFTPTAYYTLAVGSTSSNVAIAGTPAALLVSNAGPNPVAMLAGSSDSLTVTEATGLVLLPGQSQFIAAGAYLAAIALGGSPSLSTLYISAGS